MDARKYIPIKHIFIIIQPQKIKLCHDLLQIIVKKEILKLIKNILLTGVKSDDKSYLKT